MNLSAPLPPTPVPVTGVSGFANYQPCVAAVGQGLWLAWVTLDGAPSGSPRVCAAPFAPPAAAAAACFPNATNVWLAVLPDAAAAGRGALVAVWNPPGMAAIEYAVCGALDAAGGACVGGWLPRAVLVVEAAAGSVLAYPALYADGALTFTGNGRSAVGDVVTLRVALAGALLAQASPAVWLTDSATSGLPTYYGRLSAAANGTATALTFVESKPGGGGEHDIMLAVLPS